MKKPSVGDQVALSMAELLESPGYQKIFKTAKKSCCPCKEVCKEDCPCKCKEKDCMDCCDMQNCGDMKVNAVSSVFESLQKIADFQDRKGLIGSSLLITKAMEIMLYEMTKSANELESPESKQYYADLLKALDPGLQDLITNLLELKAEDPEAYKNVSNFVERVRNNPELSFLTKKLKRPVMREEFFSEEDVEEDMPTIPSFPKPPKNENLNELADSYRHETARAIPSKKDDLEAAASPKPSLAAWYKAASSELSVDDVLSAEDEAEEEGLLAPGVDEDSADDFEDEDDE